MSEIDNHAGWYLLFAKPRQKWWAQENLVRQGYTVFLPESVVEKVMAGCKVDGRELLFPRYVFIRLDNIQSKWLPIRGTLGVDRVVRFGDRCCRAPEGPVSGLMQADLQRWNLLESGDAVRITDGPFKGVEGIYQHADGLRRVCWSCLNCSRGPTFSPSPWLPYKRLPLCERGLQCRRTHSRPLKPAVQACQGISYRLLAIGAISPPRTFVQSRALFFAA